MLERSERKTISEGQADRRRSDLHQARARRGAFASSPAISNKLPSVSIKQSWIMPACAAGIVASIVAGSALLGVFGQITGTGTALASLNPLEISGLLRGNDSTDSGVGPLAVPARALDDGMAYPEITETSLPYGDSKTIVLDSDVELTTAGGENVTTITMTPPPEPVDIRFKIDHGESLVDALAEQGATVEAATHIAEALEPVFPTKLLKPDMVFTVTFDRQQDFYGRIVNFPVALSFNSGPKETITINADEDGSFVASIDGQQTNAPSRYAQFNHFHTRAKVGASLSATARDNKIPDYIVSELVRIFSYDIDFQRQVKAQDTFEAFYGKSFTGSATKRKVLHYARLTLNGQNKTLYRFTTADGITDYYDESGLSARKALLKTPVSGARLTSRFGMRRHPLLGYSKMHTGIDFGVPTGTPIRAAGSGSIEVAGRYGAYGIAVEIRHNSRYETLYAHMSRLAPGVRKGATINQGQIIGYVGTTGRSTGPHLHYEVRLNERPVNPTIIKVSGGRRLAGKDLARFTALKVQIAQMMETAPSATQVADAAQ